MRRLGIFGLLATTLLASGVAWADAANVDPPRMVVVPFLNVSGAGEAVPTVMPEVWFALKREGFEVVGNGPIEEFLRRHRIRARNAMSPEQARELAETLGARYLLFGTIDAWAIEDGPEVGLTARLVDATDGRAVWVDVVSVHAVPADGLLALGRPKTLLAATRQAVRELFDSLQLTNKKGDYRVARKQRRPGRNKLVPRPVFYRSAALDERKSIKIAILPLANRTSYPEAPSVIGDHLLIWLLGMPKVEVVDPGVFRQALIDNDIQPLYGVTRDDLRELAAVLGIDAVLDGTVLVYENGATRTPKIDVYARLRDAASGKVLWAATTVRHGDQARTLYDAGRIRGMDRLADAAASDLLSTWFR